MTTMRKRAGRLLAAIAATALLQAAAPAARAQQPGLLKISVIEATPAFHSLPLAALRAIGAEYNLQIDMLQVQGGGEAGERTRTSCPSFA
ncbi:MAG TPA: hypothetical protein VFC42_01615 [Methylomirabilota bacterium]|nr:hypothetical protein [Methylomirabilota bacterium]